MGDRIFNPGSIVLILMLSFDLGANWSISLTYTHEIHFAGQKEKPWDIITFIFVIFSVPLIGLGYVN